MAFGEYQKGTSCYDAVHWIHAFPYFVRKHRYGGCRIDIGQGFHT